MFNFSASTFAIFILIIAIFGLLCMLFKKLIKTNEEITKISLEQQNEIEKLRTQIIHGVIDIPNTHRITYRRIESPSISRFNGSIIDPYQKRNSAIENPNSTADVDPPSQTADTPNIAPVEQSSQSAENPSQTAENPSSIAESPSQSAEQPSQSAEQPSQSAEQPSQSAESPSQSAEPPSQSAEEPSKTVEEPSKTAEEPSKTAEEPSKTAEEPSKTAEEPSKTADTPVAPNVAPVDRSDRRNDERVEEPSSIAEKPSQSAESPSQSNEEDKFIMENKIKILSPDEIEEEPKDKTIPKEPQNKRKYARKQQPPAANQKPIRFNRISDKISNF